jgi:uncharacterized protein YdhG (YjbR/CyaY superfamily)
MKSVSESRVAARVGHGKSSSPVQTYINRIPGEYRSLFDRIHGLILSTCPDVEVVLSYNMPTYKIGKDRLYVGVWRHGISMYGWKAGRDGGFLQRHPELLTSKGTVRLRPDDPAISDGEFRKLIRSALGG